MKRSLIIASLLLAAIATPAKDKHDFERGTVLQMQSAPCGVSEKDGKTIAGEIFGTDGQHKNTQELLCQEYTLQTNRVVYLIRPKDDKHPALLRIGESAQFRLHKDRLLLRQVEFEDKEHEYIVVSMTPRTDASQSASASNSNPR
ncbi:MAG TPA: hypothetical protein VJN93_14300 [Candidatus Acidoferrum sp.]|nr:hypothetical protein [Candidatus Acidoferrum sp.]